MICSSEVFGHRAMRVWSASAVVSPGICNSPRSTASCLRCQIVGSLLVRTGARPEPGIQCSLEGGERRNVGDDLSAQYSGDCSDPDTRLNGQAPQGPLAQRCLQSTSNLLRNLCVFRGISHELAIRPGLMRRQPGRGLSSLSFAHSNPSSADTQTSEHTVGTVVSWRTTGPQELQVCYSFHLWNAYAVLLVDSQARVCRESGWAARAIGGDTASTHWTTT